MALRWHGLTAAQDGTGETPSESSSDRRSDGITGKKRKRPNKQGQTYAEYQKWIERTRRPYDPSFALTDRRFVRISLADIETNKKLFNEDATVRIAWNMAKAGVFGGGILLHHKDGDSKISDSTIDDTAENKWFQTIYSDLAQKALRLIWIVGFVPLSIIWDPLANKRKPAVLNLDKVDILYSCSVFDEEMWVFVSRENPEDMFGVIRKDGSLARDGGFGQGLLQTLTLPSISSSGNLFNGQILRDVWVFTSASPSADGTLNSPLSIIARRRHYLNTLMQCNLKAASNNSNPMSFTESLVGRRSGELGLDSNRQPSEAAAGAMSLNDRATDRTELEREAERQTDEWIRHHITMSQVMGGQENYQWFRDGMIATVMANLIRNSPPMTHLPDGRKFVAGKPSVAPADLIDQQVLQQQEVLMLLGTPPSTIQPESTRGRMTENNGMDIYQAHLRAVKQDLVKVVEAAYHLATDQERMAEIMHKTPLSEKLTPEKLQQKMEVSITFPGIPPPAELRQMYLDGLIKYESYVEMLSQTYVVDKDHFNAKPQVEILDVLSGGKQSMTDQSIESSEKIAKESNKLQDKKIKADTDVKKQQIKSSEKTAALAAKNKPKPAGGGASKKRK